MIGTSKCQCGCSLDWTPEHKAVAQEFDRLLKIKTGREGVLTSGTRCPEHNKKVGGSPNSAHTLQCAGDWKFFSSGDLYAILSILFDLKITRIGINFNKSFVHWDTAKDLPQKVVWKY